MKKGGEKYPFLSSFVDSMQHKCSSRQSPVAIITNTTAATTVITKNKENQASLFFVVVVLKRKTRSEKLSKGANILHIYFWLIKKPWQWKKKIYTRVSHVRSWKTNKNSIPIIIKKKKSILAMRQYLRTNRKKNKLRKK